MENMSLVLPRQLRFYPKLSFCLDTRPLKQLPIHRRKFNGSTGADTAWSSIFTRLLDTGHIERRNGMPDGRVGLVYERGRGNTL